MTKQTSTRRSVMAHSFSEVPRAQIPRSQFNRSHGLKTTFDADYLVPVLVDDVIPGDTFNVNMTFFARLATPLHPIIDNLYLESFFFFVPYRLVWDNWTKFCGARDNPTDSIDYTVPTITAWSMPNSGVLADYMGLPAGGQLTAAMAPNALPFRAYNLIWNEWFRDQNLQDSIDVDTDNGPDTNAQYVLMKRGKRHDYFTSCLPWPQKGDSVPLPLGTLAPVGANLTLGSGSVGSPIRIGDLEVAGQAYGLQQTGAPIDWTSSSTSGPNTDLYADLSTATAATVNDLRLAFQTQRLLERDARAGTRYNETILAHWGVTVPDFRIMRPEFLGGGTAVVNQNPVAQTSRPGVPAKDDQVGDLGSYGTVSGTHGFTKSFTEHGVIIGLINVRGDITYSQGAERYWWKSTRYDFYYPVLSQIGEQTVLNGEIYAVGGATTDDDVFGYQERYAEYRYKPSRLTGLMRPGVTGSLAPWHLSEEFSSLPALGDTFIQSNTGGPLDRAITVSNEPHFIGDFFFSMKCARPMPLFGIPGNLDHF